ncbi:MAG: bifunctional precorrin-2 dehydrogenase/sirohydrochlorin ferrochelatase [Actinomycetota bacterium]|nr:bifunctional precorrin-2 dehydrogenase/sirohydrochlorin ferrochelatase [Actinomycetota bacterium]
MPVDDPLYPVNLVLTGRHCLVVGGGTVAARKVDGLLAAGADVTVVAPAIAEEIRARPVTLVLRRYRAGDIDGRWLVITATDDPAVNRAVRDDGDGVGVWVNAADDPDSCSFILPAVVRQGPVMVTVSTSGYSPALASWLKGHVAAEMGPEVAVLAGMLNDAREALHAAGRSTEGIDWRSALDWDMLDLIRTGRTAQARERVDACLSSSLD